METITTTATIKTSEPENERIHQAKPLSFSNGVLKRHHSLPLHHHLPHHHAVVVTYKECLKNHAASMGGHALDGCGEFMPSPNVNPSDPTSLKCAACGCHRNFHRREPEDPPFPPPNTLPALEYQPHRRHHPPPPPNQNTNTGSHSSPSSPSPPPISSSYYHPSAPHMLLSLNSSGGGGTTPVSGGSNPNTRKRFRTKFSQNQKEKMLEFAERIEWKIQKRDEEIINGFCNEIGVEKGVLKVWMHNNKNKKDPNSNLLAISTDGNENGAGAGVGIGVGVAVVTAEESSAGNYNHHHVLTATTNGSASSS